MVKPNKTGIDYNLGERLIVRLRDTPLLLVQMVLVEVLANNVLRVRFDQVPPQRDIYDLERDVDIEARYCYRNTPLFKTLYF